MNRNITDKIVNLDILSSISTNLNYKLVFTNGCFDILHYGHFKLLEKARSLGDMLIVAINSDKSVKINKGNSRPINNEVVRAFCLACIDFVDFVLIFDEPTPELVLSQIRPDILVKGGDYNLDSVLGKEFVKNVVLVDFEHGYSSSTLINRIKSETI